MTLILRGGEFIATEALSASVLAGLSDLARRRPLVINGLELHRQDLAELAKEARAKANRCGLGYHLRRLQVLIKYFRPRSVEDAGS